MEDIYLQVGFGLVSFGLTWLAEKSYNVHKPFKKIMDHIRLQYEARKDNKLTQKEKAALYDSLEGTVFEVYAYAKGLSFWRSK